MVGGRLGLVRERLVASFWFIPALITAGAVALFFLTQYLDQLTRTSLPDLPILFSGGAQAARSVLSTIAGSLITVIGTVFSITIVTLQLASSSYTPRVLRGFTEDRRVQAVLGTYIATFLYALLVLRIVRTPESESASFNPVISVTTAVVLALVCVGLLIYFVAHVVGIIQSSSITERAHEDAMGAIAKLEDLRDGANAEGARYPEERPELSGLIGGEPLVVRARRSGYVQYLNPDAVADAVAGTDGYRDVGKIVLEIPFGPGEFVAAGLPIARIWPALELGRKAENEVHGAFYFGRERSFRQDFAFGLRQLSDIALKGLSPGVNDPTTAMQAMDRMEAIFVALGDKALPVRVRERDANGKEVLIKVCFYGFEDAVGLAFDQVRRAAFTSGQVAVLERLLEILEHAIGANPLTERRLSFWARAMSVARQAPHQVPDPEDAANLVCRAVKVGARLLETGLGKEVGADLEELRDSSEGLRRGGERVREAVRFAREGEHPDRRAGS